MRIHGWKTAIGHDRQGFLGTMRTISTKVSALLAVLVLSAALAGPAYAQSSKDGYNDEAAVIQSESGGNNDNNGESKGSSLPFTGLDVGLIAASGALLLAAGVGMRRLTRGPRSA
jgi:hypothetical protein